MSKKDRELEEFLQKKQKFDTESMLDLSGSFDISGDYKSGADITFPFFGIFRNRETLKFKEFAETSSLILKELKNKSISTLEKTICADLIKSFMEQHKINSFTVHAFENQKKLDQIYSEIDELSQFEFLDDINKNLHVKFMELKQLIEIKEYISENKTYLDVNNKIIRPTYWNPIFRYRFTFEFPNTEDVYIIYNDDSVKKSGAIAKFEKKFNNQNFETELKEKLDAQRESYIKRQMSAHPEKIPFQFGDFFIMIFGSFLVTFLLLLFVIHTSFAVFVQSILLVPLFFGSIFIWMSYIERNEDHYVRWGKKWDLDEKKDRYKKARREEKDKIMWRIQGTGVYDENFIKSVEEHFPQYLEFQNNLRKKLSRLAPKIYILDSSKTDDITDDIKNNFSNKDLIELSKYIDKQLITYKDFNVLTWMMNLNE